MNLDFPIHHVVVVGFHHKKGCQVEYSFPPLDVEIEKSAWKHLPTLAIPDGAHNYERDTVYFHLPSLKNPNETVFGVSCYQQIQSDQLVNRPDDVTRSTVQKSVCVLSKYPLYGHIQVKMELITAAYFREGDFDKVSILEEAFHNLNACLTAELLDTPEAFVGLSPRDLIFQFRHQVLVLFKLILLEKKILFHGAAVGPLCSSLLTLISLLPLTLEHGLNLSACIRASKSFSIVPQFSNEGDDEADLANVQRPKPQITGSFASRYQGSRANTQSKTNNDSKPSEGRDEKYEVKSENADESDAVAELRGTPDFMKKGFDGASPMVSQSNSKTSLLTIHDEDESLSKNENVPDFYTAVQLSPSDAGLPLSLFNKGYLCYPYLSLHYLDLLSDSRVRGFVVGATNILFKQKKDLVDAVVEMQDGSIEILDPNLKRNLVLTTADLRFAEGIVKQVTSDKGTDGSDSFMDGVGWEGGDEWIRAQFKYYLMCLMRTSLLEDDTTRQKDSFGPSYIYAWRNTNNWRIWNDYVNSEERNTPGIFSIAPGHPCEGNMSVNDMKLRLSHTMQSTVGGRRMTEAVTSTGKVVAQTGKAVGGALTSAKGALTSWWSTMTTPAVASVSQSQSRENMGNNGTEKKSESEPEEMETAT